MGFLDLIKESVTSGPTRWKTKCERSLTSIYPVLQGMDSHELGFTLDDSIKVRERLISGCMMKHLFPEKHAKGDLRDSFRRLKIPREVFIDTTLVSDEIKFDSLEQMLEIITEDNGGYLSGMITIWSVSICSLSFAEFRIQGKKIWKEFSRGFEYCSIFNPEEDIPISLREFQDAR